MADLKSWGETRLNRLRRDLDTIFDAFCEDYGLPPMSANAAGAGLGDMALKDAGDALLVTFTARGLAAEDLELQATAHHLTVTAKAHKVSPGRRSFQSQSSTIALPCPVVPDKAAASMEDETITITLPKAALPGPMRLALRCK